MILAFEKTVPKISDSCFIADTATLIGDVVVEEFSSIWFQTVVRGDIASIRIGRQTNIQDLCVLHCRRDRPVMIGREVTVGHRVILHGCTVMDRVLIGMGSVVLDGAEIGENSVIGAGSLVTPGTRIPAGSLAFGSPARVQRPVRDDESAWIGESAANYVALSRRYQETRGGLIAPV